MVLAGDIGGTNTRLAFYEGTPNRLTAVATEIFRSADHNGPEDIVEAFIAKYSKVPAAACFGIAGAVREGVVETTNLPWIVSEKKLSADLGIKHVSLINDLEANAHGIALLSESDFVCMHAGKPIAGGNRALISAGTGLGEAGLLAERDGSYRPFPSEGGHVDFAARNELEVEMLRYLHSRFEHVSYERVLSGPGFMNIYEFLRDTGRYEEPAWLKEKIQYPNPSAVVAQSGLEGTSEIAVKALDMFISIYGAEAGNLALKVVATGGVFVGGGIAPKLIAKLNGPTFLNAFWAKGRVSPLLRDIPVRVITNDKTALLGAGRVAALAASANSAH